MQGHSASSPCTARGTSWGLTVGVRQMKARRAQGTAQSSLEFTVLDPHRRCSSGERLEGDSVWLAYYGPDIDVRYDSRVCRIDRKMCRGRRLDSGIKFTERVAFGPDKFLYADETLTKMIFGNRWSDRNRGGPHENLGNVDNPRPASPGRTGWDSLQHECLS